MAWLERLLLFCLMLSAWAAASVNAACPPADLNGDCVVDFEDVKILAEQWLDTGPQLGDVTKDEEVGLHDLAVLGEQWRQAGVPLTLNEFMAANSTFVADQQGEYDDWIEIHNESDQPIDVSGMYLTDDADNPAKWRIPTSLGRLTTIPGRGYLVIWADGDIGAPGLHAGFRLNAGGGELYMLDRDGVTVIDAVEYGPQAPDVSYGRYPNARGAWRFMGQATPGGPNVEIYQGFVAEPQFSHDRGFYDAPFALTVTCETPEATIYYTLDGTEPYQTGGRFPTGRAYTGPIQIGTSACVRVKAIKPGWMPSSVVTRTYLFLGQTIRQPNRPGGWPTSWGGTGADYEMDPEIVNAHLNTIKEDLLSLPTMSLVMKLDDLFDGSGGIYANWNNQGVAWERPGSIEMIHPDGTEGFQSNCGVRIYGGVGRREKKKSFRLLFKGMYGATKLRYPLFGEDAVDEFDTIILRANFNDGYPFGQEATQCIRDEYCRRLQLALGHPSPHGIFVHLYVNGAYWGLYNPVERPDASFAASYFGGEKEEYDAYNSGSPTGESTSQSWSGLLSTVRAGGDTSEGYQRLQGNDPDGTPNPDYVDYLDVEPYIDFMIANFFVGNTDWPGHNWYGAMNRVNSTGFKFFMWDAEWVLWIQVGHGLDSDLQENMTYVSNSMCEPYARLRNNPEFRVLFGDRVHRAFLNDGPLYVDPQNPRWNPNDAERNRPAALYAELANWIERAMIPESARWGDVHGGSPRTIAHWRTERDRILNTYMTQRPDIVLGQIRSAGLYPYVNAPVFHINGTYQHGGHIATSDRLSLAGAGGTVYYTLDGTDPRVPATGSVPEDDDAGVLVLVPEEAPKRVLVPAGPVSEAWRGGPAFDDSAWIISAGGHGGIGYERSSGYEGYITADLGQKMYNVNSTCYIRIPFTFTEDLDDSDQVTLRIRYDDGFIAYLNGVEVAKRNFTGEPAWNSAATGQNSDVDAVNFEDITLADGRDALKRGNNLLAIHGLNVSTTSSDFLISVALVVGAGGGSAVESGAIAATAVRYAGPVTLVQSTPVKARALSGVTWSALNEAVFAVGPVAESLRVSELMYHPADPNAEYIELTNVGGETINLNLARFINGIDFTFPGMELAPGDHCLLVRDVAAFEAAYGAGLNIAGQYAGSLNNAGERLVLQDAAGQTIHNFRFQDRWYDITDGRGFSLTVKDPATADPGTLGDKAAWRPSAQVGGSPGYDDAGHIPELGAVVINELLANSVGGTPDWIELHNTTDRTINIGGWFLSDDADDLTRYEIAEGTAIAAGGYLVFYQDRHFGNQEDAGCRTPFALNRDGETVYLHSGSGGLLGGYSEQEKFDASDPGVSLGRYRKSTGAYNFVALSEPTPGGENAYPQVGPVVITEIMYHPDDPGDAEYVELLNIGSSSVTLYDAVGDAPWRFTDDPDVPGIEFLFPTDQPIVLTPGERLVLVKDLTSFNARFAVPVGVKVFAWGAGSLANGSEKIQLSKPGSENADGTRNWIRVDRVVYSDGAHPEDFPEGLDPWPVEADGRGSSLSRIDPAAYGNDPENWRAAAPTPGGF